MIRNDQILEHLLSSVHQEGLIKVMTGKYIFDEPIEQQDPALMAQLRELEEKLLTELNRVKKDLEESRQRTSKLHESCTNLTAKAQKLIQEVNYIRTRANENLLQMQTIQKNQDKLQKEIEEMHELIEKQEYVSKDGTLTWKIDRFADRMAEAQSERQSSIYSPIFYSSANGYKMRARVFLFGDGSARRTHMSIFFFLMKGEYDSILKWPFSHRITFCLLDQSGANSHVIDSFQPDVKSNSFKRPTTDSNIASGIPKFFPLTTLQQDNNPYVREDTMYLKVIVELTEIPRLMLPILLTLNPALPNHVQEALAQQEVTRRQQAPTTLAASVSPVLS